ncbi:tetratricopeptide repeat-containing protein [Toxoplasma gondii ME49]|uniref:Protein KIAA0664 homolog n=3 Tax=Toxoplasma gondii TaxID=5811 RepID=B6KHQ9_TOXGV|nr:tetratricopeptide repeat-containing protein [Toxoplasma gondii ME49]AEH16744.1 transmembrane pellicle protein 1 [Toxoplasma gondii]EPT25206.1 tetratricopeptide repeat-containing protein [Toxoplasma gondii ME49]ESS34518.1 tetratricopeptide repeat-containing protein [Toxoplasma gondii VEG]CEL78661.1 TPA: Protein KIAA0664 homolog [Toxoplasma gondii VEG]|eukprot:XP_002367382.1 tetratricopeptide repeat-containing protein [Toxoplasma gondii ME49]
MELFGDQYIRITIALPAFMGACSASSSESNGATALQTTGKDAVSAAVVAAPGLHSDMVPLGKLRASTSGENKKDEGLYTPPRASEPDSAVPDYLSVVAEVAFHETVAELRWVLLELLPSCFFTNYDVFFRGKRVDENLPFSALSVEADDVFHLVPLLYDEKAVRIHIRRFQEIALNASVLLMRRLPDPADPAGPYGAFLKPLVLLEQPQELALDLEWMGDGREESPAFLELPGDDEGREELSDAQGEAGPLAGKKATRTHAAGGRRKLRTRGGAGRRSEVAGYRGDEETSGDGAGKPGRGGGQREKRMHSGNGEKVLGKDKDRKPVNLTQLLFRDPVYGGAAPQTGGADEQGPGSRCDASRPTTRNAQKISNFLLHSPVTLEPRKKPKCFTSLKTSDLSPPPPSRRLQGDLWYLELCTLENQRLAIICREDGFLVASVTAATDASGRSLETLFPRNRLVCPQGTSVAVDSERGRALTFHTLSDLLCTYSPAYRAVLPSLAPEQLDTDLPYHVMPTLQARNHFLVAKDQTHDPDSNRLEEYLEKVSGIDPWEPERQWNNEVEALRRMRVHSLQDHIDFEKASFKLFVEFQHFAIQAAMNVREGRLGGGSSDPPSVSSCADSATFSPCMHYGASPVGTDEDVSQTRQRCCGIVSAEKGRVPASPSALPAKGEIIFRGQMAIERAADPPLPLAETHAGETTEESSTSGPRSRRRDRRELKADTRGYELLEMMNAYQRQRGIELERREPEATQDEEGQAREARKEAQEKRIKETDKEERSLDGAWHLQAPYPLLIDYAGCRLRCQSVSPLQLLAARARERREAWGHLCRDERVKGHNGENAGRSGKNREEETLLQHEEEQEVIDAPALKLLESSVFGGVLGLKTHTIRNPATGKMERRLLHSDADVVAEASDNCLHLLSLGSLCPVDLSSALELESCVSSVSSMEKQTAEASAQKNEKVRGRETSFDRLRPELMSAFLQFHRRREEARSLASQARQARTADTEQTTDREDKHAKREAKGKETKRLDYKREENEGRVERDALCENGGDVEGKDLAPPPLSRSDVETPETSAADTTEGGVASEPVSAEAKASSPSLLEGEGPCAETPRDLTALLQEELRLRLEHEVYRRVPLLPAFFSAMQTWYKPDLELGFFYQTGSPHAAHLREKTREATAHILFKCLDLTRSQQHAAVLEHRKEYETLRRELAARGALLPSETGEGGTSAADDNAEARGDRNLAEHAVAPHTDAERREEALKAEGRLEAEGAGKEAEGEDLSSFQLTEEDGRMMELLGRDVSLLDPSLDLEERAQQLAEQVCSLTFSAQPGASSPEEEAQKPVGAVPRLFNLNLERGVSAEAVSGGHGVTKTWTGSNRTNCLTDEAVLADAAKYLHGVAVPLVATLLGQHLCVTPLESESLKGFFHAFGVNMRYLGAVTHMIETGRDLEISRDPALDEPVTHVGSLAVRTLQLEMTIRAAKHVLAAFFAPLRMGHLSAAVAHLLSCLLCPPGVEYPSSRFPLPAAVARDSAARLGGPASDASVDVHCAGLADSRQDRALRHLAQLTPDSLWTLVRRRMQIHFGYTAPANRADWRCLCSPSGRYVVLRGVASALGIQLKAGSPLLGVLGAVSLWERWGGVDEAEGPEEGKDVSGKSQLKETHSGTEGAEGSKAARREGRVDKKAAMKRIVLGDSEVSTDVMTDADPDSPVSVSRAEEVFRSEEDTNAHAAVTAAKPLRSPEGRTATLGCRRLPATSPSSWRAGGPAEAPTASVWKPLSTENVSQIFPVVKREPVVSHFARHLLAAATQCYVLGWLDVAHELLQQVLFVVHQLTGSICRETALCYAAMGEVALSLQDFLNAANNFQKALILTERCVGSDHPDTIDIHAGLGRTLVHCPGREFQERGLEHLHRAIELRRLWTGDVAHPETPLLLVTAAKCLLKVYGPKCAAQLPEYLDRAILLAGRVRGVGPQFVAEMHSDASQIYQIVGDFRSALEHCRIAGQLVAADPCADGERMRELDERLLFLTQQAVLVAKKRRHENVQRAQLLNRLRTAVTMKRQSNIVSGSPGFRFPRGLGVTGLMA